MKLTRWNRFAAAFAATTSLFGTEFSNKFVGFSYHNFASASVLRSGRYALDCHSGGSLLEAFAPTFFSIAKTPSTVKSPTKVFFASFSAEASTVQPNNAKYTNPNTSKMASQGSNTATVENTTVVLKHTKQPVEKFRKDYKPPTFDIKNVDLSFDLHDDSTKVHSKLTISRRAGTAPAALILDGEDLKLQHVKIDSKVLSNDLDGYTINVDGKLVISEKQMPAEAETPFVLETLVIINPLGNLQLSGLYKSNALFCTQCEAEGFRRITYFLDRPDVMSLYKVRIEADKALYPVLLSNGNKVDAGDMDGNRHFAVFVDPHKKPCYLFALVAGHLYSLADHYVTKSGRDVSIQLFSEGSHVSKLEWAMESVKKSMKWDEDVFGLEYDLDNFNVVCVNDFNMGAMENKGLNIFNCKLLLADPKTTTDVEYQRIMNVVGHEYFHNWTGNRVTCRDWFQLTLKEGLTVFRDQIFTADMYSAAVKRIEDVTVLRARQYPEDDGPMAHPIRPESYIAMDNFYTATVYDKGAEIIRMYQTILGKEGFRKGMDLYFERHDGQAVTCDDFRAAMADANGKDLSLLERWYLQAGTPELIVLEAKYLPDTKSYKLKVKQQTKPTPGQPQKLPFLIPIAVGLIGKDKKKDLLNPPTKILEMTEEEQEFIIPNVSEDCVLSILRGFSAPVKLRYEQSQDEIAFLMAYDTDDLSKWQASQALASSILLKRANEIQAKSELSELPDTYLKAISNTLSSDADSSIKALTIRLPDSNGLAQEMNPIDPDALSAAYKSVRRDVYKAYGTELRELYNSLTLEKGSKEPLDQHNIARRRLRNAVLYFLTAMEDKEAAELAYTHFTSAMCMTDQYSSLSNLVNMQHPERDLALKTFYDQAAGDPIVLDKWFMVQAMADVPDALERVKSLKDHPDYSIKTPNRMRSLIFSFTNNMVHFHRGDGEGYKFVVDILLQVDKINPITAARGISTLLNWKKFDEKRQALIKAQLERVLSTPGLSPDSLEIAQKALA